MVTRPASSADAQPIVEIHNDYIVTSHATFGTDPIDFYEMFRRMDDDWADGFPFYYARKKGEVVGHGYGR
jgi:L-amino acid N-acyltransferase YncA